MMNRPAVLIDEHLEYLRAWRGRQMSPSVRFACVAALRQRFALSTAEAEQVIAYWLQAEKTEQRDG